MTETAVVATEVPSNVITRHKLDLGGREGAVMVATGKDHHLLAQAIETLRAHFIQAVTDGRFGQVGVSISFDAGRPTHMQDSVTGTKR